MPNKLLWLIFALLILQGCTFKPNRQPEAVTSIKFNQPITLRLKLIDSTFTMYRYPMTDMLFEIQNPGFPAKYYVQRFGRLMISDTHPSLIKLASLKPGSFITLRVVPTRISTTGARHGMLLQVKNYPGRYLHAEILRAYP